MKLFRTQLFFGLLGIVGWVWAIVIHVGWAAPTPYLTDAVILLALLGALLSVVSSVLRLIIRRLDA